MSKPSCFFPVFLSFLILSGIPSVGAGSQKEDFVFLDQTFDEARLVNSGKDLVESVSVFFVSTLASFEVRYWLLELARKGLNPGSELSSRSPDIMEIASVWTVSSVIWGDQYSDWPRNSVLHFYMRAGGALQTVVAGLFLARGRITVPALSIIFLSAESLAETAAGAVTTLAWKRAGAGSDKISPNQYDINEYFLSSIGIGWSTGLIVFESLVLRWVSPVKCAVTCMITAALSTTTVEATMYISGLNIQSVSMPIAIARSAATAAAGAIVIALAITGAGAIVITLATTGARARAFIVALAGARTLVETIAGTVAGAGAVAGAIVGVGAGAASAAEATPASAAEAVVVAVVVAVVTAIAVGGAGAGALFTLVKPGPISDTRYSRVTAVTAVASLFAFVSSIANYLNKGVPLNETFLEISWSYWCRLYEYFRGAMDGAMDCLWTGHFSSQ